MKKIELPSNENYGDLALKRAVGEIVQRIGKNLPELQQPISMYLAGGVAINFYTGYRSTRDIDASFSRLILLPKKEELAIAYVTQAGEKRSIYLDTNYNNSFAIIHPDHEDDSLVVEGEEFKNKNICLKILNPVDLAVSKIARFVGKDKEDIEQLALNKLINAPEVEQRTIEALDYYIGNTTMISLNLQEAIEIINQTQERLTESSKKQQLPTNSVEQNVLIEKEALETAQLVQQMLENIGELQTDGSLTFSGSKWQFTKSPGNVVKIIVIQNDKEILKVQGERIITFQPTLEEQGKLKEFRAYIRKENQQSQRRPKL